MLFTLIVFEVHLNATNMHMCKCSTGDISVLAHCKSLSEFSVFYCYAVTGRQIPPYLPSCFFLEAIFADDVCCRCFAGDIQVFENTPSMTTINLSSTKCTGKDTFYAHLFLVDHLNATNMHMCECSTGDISVLAHCKSLSFFNAFKCNGATGKHFPHISPCFILEPIFADNVCCRCFVGDIQVFENTPSMTKIYLDNTKCTGEDAFYAHFFS